MKTATFPSLRVDPELRLAAEAVLEDGETLSSFMEQSLRALIDRRCTHQAFLERGLASRDEAARTGERKILEKTAALSDRITCESSCGDVMRQ